MRGKSLDRRAKGVYPIAITPFEDNGSMYASGEGRLL